MLKKQKLGQRILHSLNDGVNVERGRQCAQHLIEQRLFVGSPARFLKETTVFNGHRCLGGQRHKGLQRLFIQPIRTVTFN